MHKYANRILGEGQGMFRMSHEMKLYVTSCLLYTFSVFTDSMSTSFFINAQPNAIELNTSFRDIVKPGISPLHLVQFSLWRLAIIYSILILYVFLQKNRLQIYIQRIFNCIFFGIFFLGAAKIIASLENVLLGFTGWNIASLIAYALQPSSQVVVFGVFYGVAFIPSFYVTQYFFRNTIE